MRIFKPAQAVVWILTLSLAASNASITLGGIVVHYSKIAGTGAEDFAVPEQDLNGKGWSSFQVNVSTDDGSNISAVDVSFDGPMHQRWQDAFIDCGFVGSCVSPRGLAENRRGDSHLTQPSLALIATAPFENSNSSPIAHLRSIITLQSPLPSTPSRLLYGVGDRLEGVWGIPGQEQTTTAQIALLVIPDGQTVQFSYSIATAGTTGETFHGTSLIGIPEPTTLALGYLGCVIMARRPCRLG